jgi:hypothetical protein
LAYQLKSIVQRRESPFFLELAEEVYLLQGLFDASQGLGFLSWADGHFECLVKHIQHDLLPEVLATVFRSFEFEVRVQHEGADLVFYLQLSGMSSWRDIIVSAESVTPDCGLGLENLCPDLLARLGEMEDIAVSGEIAGNLLEELMKCKVNDCKMNKDRALPTSTGRSNIPRGTVGMAAVAPSMRSSFISMAAIDVSANRKLKVC